MLENEWYTKAFAKHTTDEKFINTHDISNPDPSKPLAKCLDLVELSKRTRGLAQIENWRDIDICRVCGWGDEGKLWAEVDWHMEHR
jgi:hypothetical protein